MVAKILSIVVLCVLLMSFAAQLDFSDRIAQLKKEKKLVPLSTGMPPKAKVLSTQHIALGRMLFHDKLLSKKSNVSCASCHMPDRGFSNGAQFAEGTHGNVSKRNVPHLHNLALNTSFYWDGRVSTLEEQFHQVVQSKDELDMTFKELVARLNASDEYRQKFNDAFPGESISKRNITRAVVAYELSLTAVQSRYDLFLMGDTAAMSVVEKKGFELFIGKANCIACHHGPNLTDNTFHNVGVVTTDLGRHAVDKVGMKNEFGTTPYPFFSMYKAFKTPSLRNAPVTAPYFHDGSKKTLEEVIEFYNKGGENRDRTGLAKEIQPLNLSDEEKTALREFINTLSSPNTENE